MLPSNTFSSSATVVQCNACLQLAPIMCRSNETTSQLSIDQYLIYQTLLESLIDIDLAKVCTYMCLCIYIYEAKCSLYEISIHMIGFPNRFDRTHLSCSLYDYGIEMNTYNRPMDSSTSKLSYSGPGDPKFPILLST